MASKGLVIVLIVVAAGACTFILMKDNKATNTTNIVEKSINDHNKENNNITQSAGIDMLPTDIIRLISEGNKTVCNITPDNAKKELDKRQSSGEEIAIDKNPVQITKLPFDILRLISQSHLSAAGIQPKTAMNEIIRRYLSLKLTSPEDVNSTVLLEALQIRQEQESIDEWADNEDSEAVEQFMKEEADRDPSSIANAVYGIRHYKDRHNEAMTYMDRYANHPDGDAYDNQSEKKAYETLIDTMKHIK